MKENFDPAIDWLTDAPLTPEQREVWNALRSEVVAARLTVIELEKRIYGLEHSGTDLTTVLNRPDFNREVARMLAFNDRYGGVSSVVYINIENMETTAEQHGKAIVDACIRQACNVLAQHVRGSDVLGRLAGDEFGVLLGQCDNADAWRKGEQLASFLRAGLLEVQNVKLGLKIYYGAYTFKDDKDIGVGIKEAAKVMTTANPNTAHSKRSADA